jgi:hypothetical protein
MLRTASEETPRQRFVCQILDPQWNQFVELWAPRIHAFVFNAFGPYGKEPLTEIRKLQDGHHIAGATASFDPSTGQIRLSTSVQGNPGQILEKLTHEMTHGALAQFPEGDAYYEEGWVDYSVWVMAHAPLWEPYRDSMIQSAEGNIRNRRERALRGGSDWDRKRWSGGLYASVAFGPYIVATLKQRKTEGNFTW